MASEAARQARARRLLKRGVAQLTAADSDLARIHDQFGLPPTRIRPPGFQTLFKIIVQQQVSLAAGEAIWSRLATALEGPTARSVRATDAATLRGLGLSLPKARYAHHLADAVLDRSLDFDQLDTLEDDAAIEMLTAIKGIGRWTAEVYMLSVLQRPDVWPAADVALMTAAGEVKGLDPRPDAKALIALAEPWRPWRAIAARLLWHHYRHSKGRDTGL